MFSQRIIRGVVAAAMLAAGLVGTAGHATTAPVSAWVPTQHAIDLGAARVWVLDVASEFHGWADERMTAMDVLLESFAISRSHLGRRSPIAGAHQQVVNLPPLRIGRHDLRDFSKTARLLAAGREAGRAMIAAERSRTLSAKPAAAS